MIRPALPALALLLAGCGGSPEAATPSAAGTDEARALDEAAQMAATPRPEASPAPASPMALPPG